MNQGPLTLKPLFLCTSILSLVVLIYSQQQTKPKKTLARKRHFQSQFHGLNNTFYFVFREHAVAFGRAHNQGAGDFCLDTLQNDDQDTYKLGVFACNDAVTSTQFFSLSRDDTLVRKSINRNFHRICSCISKIENFVLSAPRRQLCRGQWGQDPSGWLLRGDEALWILQRQSEVQKVGKGPGDSLGNQAMPWYQH